MRTLVSFQRTRPFFDSRVSAKANFPIINLLLHDNGIKYTTAMPKGTIGAICYTPHRACAAGPAILLSTTLHTRPNLFAADNMIFKFKQNVAFFNMELYCEAFLRVRKNKKQIEEFLN